MHQELMNQDIARLHRAEILRESSRLHLLEAKSGERRSHAVRARVVGMFGWLTARRPAARYGHR